MQKAHAQRDTQEETVLEEALAAFTNTVGVKGRLVSRRASHQNRRAFGILAAKLARTERRFTIQVKKVDREAAVLLIKNQLKSFPDPGLLVVPYMTPHLAEFCRKIQMQFIDTAGNMYIRQKDVYLFVIGQKPPAKLQALRPQNRVHNPPGLKVIFALITQPRLAQAPYRTIQESTGVALGTVVNTLGVLARMGCLKETQNPRKRLWDYPKLIDLWAESYPQKLRIACAINRFRAPEENWWQNIALEKLGALWSGEVAAAKLTKYLKPETSTIYTYEPAGRIIAAGRLRPDPKGNVEILTAFWNNTGLEPLPVPHIVPALLIYADLLAIGDGRTAEIAKKIYDEYVFPALG